MVCLCVCMCVYSHDEVSSLLTGKEEGIEKVDDNSLTLLLQVASHRFLELQCNYMDICHNVSAYTPPNIPNILSIHSPHINVHSTI